jgi:hypothetical protein
VASSSSNCDSHSWGKTWCNTMGLTGRNSLRVCWWPSRPNGGRRGVDRDGLLHHGAPSPERNEPAWVVVVPGKAPHLHRGSPGRRRTERYSGPRLPVMVCQGVKLLRLPRPLSLGSRHGDRWRWLTTTKLCPPSWQAIWPSLNASPLSMRTFPLVTISLLHDRACKTLSTPAPSKL